MHQVIELSFLLSRVWRLKVLSDFFSHKKCNKMQQGIKILFHIYMKLSMFRATYRPPSGA